MSQETLYLIDGSAYIYRRQGDGSWVREAKLTAADGASSDYFGYAVALTGDVALVGADGDDANGSSSGSAYLVRRRSRVNCSQ